MIEALLASPEKCSVIPTIVRFVWHANDFEGSIMCVCVCCDIFSSRWLFAFDYMIRTVNGEQYIRLQWKSMLKPVENFAISHMCSRSAYTFKKWNFVFYKSI